MNEIGSYAHAMNFAEHYSLLGDIHKAESSEWWRGVKIQAENAKDEPVAWMFK